MKKSEMVKELQKITKGKLSETYLSCLLSQIQTLGMLPPTTLVTIDTGLVDQSDSAPIYKTIKKNEWEPEDETQ